MPHIKVGRYPKDREWIPDKYDPKTGKAYCRNCGKLCKKKNMRYCCKECRHEWWKNNTPFAWNWLREEALDRDNYKCVKCGEKATQVHHIKPVILYPELEFDINNLQSVCTEHHKHDMKKEKNIKYNRKLEQFEIADRDTS